MDFFEKLFNIIKRMISSDQKSAEEAMFSLIVPKDDIECSVSRFTMACFFSFCLTLFTFMGWFLGGRLPLLVFAFIVTVLHK